MENYIYVLAKDGTPIMPTKREHHIQKLLKKGMARVVSHNPFVVQMKYNVGKETQPLYGGTDPGRTNIGNAVVNEKGEVVYKDHVTTNNSEVPKHMAERKSHRQASRRGERQARKRLAKKHDTTTEFPEGRILPGCSEPVMLKDIINTEARFANRKRDEGWLTPTATHLVRTHINMITHICSILPVTSWTFEINRFAFMKMDDGSVFGTDFQNGRMKGYENVESYVFSMQSGKCACCGGIIEHYHHIVPRHEHGSNLPENIIGVCNDCHEKIHTGKKNVDFIGMQKKYDALSILNQAVPYVLKEIESKFGKDNVSICRGTDTAKARETYGIEKDHPADAVCIATMFHTDSVKDNIETYEVVQFRRHNRAIINNQKERTYYLDGKLVAKNRNPRFEQKGPALSDLNLSREEISHLTVKKSRRYYNEPDRIMPGAEILYEDKRYILTGQLTGGKYFRVYNGGKKNIPANKCRIIKNNTGLVYV